MLRRCDSGQGREGELRPLGGLEDSEDTQVVGPRPYQVPQKRKGTQCWMTYVWGVWRARREALGG